MQVHPSGSCQCHWITPSLGEDTSQMLSEWRTWISALTIYHHSGTKKPDEDTTKQSTDIFSVSKKRKEECSNATKNSFMCYLKLDRLYTVYLAGIRLHGLGNVSQESGHRSSAGIRGLADEITSKHTRFSFSSGTTSVTLLYSGKRQAVKNPYPKTTSTLCTDNLQQIQYIDNSCDNSVRKVNGFLVERLGFDSQ
jgi:hypothetical protein